IRDIVRSEYVRAIGAPIAHPYAEPRPSRGKWSKGTVHVNSDIRPRSIQTRDPSRYTTFRIPEYYVTDSGKIDSYTRVHSERIDDERSGIVYPERKRKRKTKVAVVTESNDNALLRALLAESARREREASGLKADD